MRLLNRMRLSREAPSNCDHVSQANVVATQSSRWMRSRMSVFRVLVDWMLIGVRRIFGRIDSPWFFITFGDTATRVRLVAVYPSVKIMGQRPCNFGLQLQSNMPELQLREPTETSKQKIVDQSSGILKRMSHPPGVIKRNWLWGKFYWLHARTGWHIVEHERLPEYQCHLGWRC